MEMFLEQKSRKEATSMVSDMVDECFSACIYNFRTRKIDAKEKLCLYQCSDKYFRVVSRANRIMMEQNLIQNAPGSPAPQ